MRIVRRDRDVLVFVLQAEDGIRDLVRSRGLGDVYKRQLMAEIDEVAKVVRCAETAGRREIAGDLVAPRLILSLIHI